MAYTSGVWVCLGGGGGAIFITPQHGFQMQHVGRLKRLAFKELPNQTNARSITVVFRSWNKYSTGGKGKVMSSCELFAELDALGDELLLDDDSSYLDEASAAPSIPEGIPSDGKTNKVQYPQNSYYT